MIEQALVHLDINLVSSTSLFGQLYEYNTGKNGKIVDSYVIS